MEDIVEQMKRIQSRIGSVIDNSNQQNQPASRGNEIVGGEGIEVKSDGGKVSISQSQQPQQPQQPSITLPEGTGVLGINNGVLFVYGTVDCE